MFGIDSTEFLVIVIIAVIVIGPKDLPRALYKVGQIVGKAQGMARHFRTGIDAMVAAGATKLGFIANSNGFSASVHAGAKTYSERYLRSSGGGGG